MCCTYQCITSYYCVSYAQYTIHYTVMIIFAILLFMVKNTDSTNCNLKQTTLELLTFSDPTYIQISKDLTNQNFDFETQTFEVSKLVSGKYFEILDILAHQCNFKYELHLLNSSSLGDIVQQNQSYIITGFYKALLNSSHDFH